MLGEAPYKWEVKVVGDPLNGLYLGVDGLMDLRNKMGQFQKETNTPRECLLLLDYLVQAAQYAYRNGRETAP